MLHHRFSVRKGFVLDYVLVTFEARRLLGKSSSVSYNWSSFFHNRFVVYPHYPKQFVRHFVKELPTMGMWPNRGKHSPRSYVMRFNIKGMEVLERRYKRNKPCATGLPDFDDLVIQEVLTKLGCKPPYWASWKSSTPLPTCKEVNKMGEAAKLVANLTYSYETQEDIMSSAPCRGLERIDFDHFDDEFSDEELSVSPVLNETLGFYFYFKESTYKELKHVKSIDEQSLIGNLNTKYCRRKYGNHSKKRITNG